MQQQPGFFQQQQQQVFRQAGLGFVNQTDGAMQSTQFNGANQAIQAQMLAARGNGQFSPATVQAAMFQLRQQQQLLNPAGGFPQNNNVAAAAAAAAAVAATQAQARAQQQARAAALLGNAGQTITAQQTALMNAALMQRAATAGQLQFQNGKPALFQQQQQQTMQQQQPSLQQVHAAALQQLQLNQAQKNMQAANYGQLEAAIARTNLMKAAAASAAQQNGQAQLNSLYQQMQQQQLPVNSNCGAGGGIQQTGGQVGGPGNAQQQRSWFTPQHQLSLIQALMQSRNAANQATAGGGGGGGQLQGNQLQQLQMHLQAQRQQQVVQAVAIQQQQQLARLQQLQQMQAQAQHEQQQRAAAQHAASQQAAAQHIQRPSSAASSILSGADPSDGHTNGLKQMGAQGGHAMGNGHTQDGGAPMNGGTGMVNEKEKEQRMMALASVAVQLARGGVSVEQAINSGIMGGMSATDVRFIVECYNSERLRMQNRGLAGNDGGLRAHLPERASAENVISSLQQQGQLEDEISTSPPLPGALKTSESLVQAATVVSELAGNLSQEVLDANAFNAFSYGFFGEINPTLDEVLLEDGALGGLDDAPLLGATLESGGGLEEDGGFKELGGALEDEEDVSVNEGLLDAGGPTAALATPYANDLSTLLEGGANGAAAELVAELAKAGSAGGNATAAAAAAAIAASATAAAITAAAAAGGQVGGEADQDLNAALFMGMGLSQTEAAWLQAAANANKALWAGTAESDDVDKANNDDLDARLANLDLGSGFF